PYQREDFHHHPEQYECLFHKYIGCTDILMNGIYWQKNIQPLFEVADVQNPDFSILTIADITDDMHGSVPINLGDSTIDDPVYGVDRNTLQKTAPYLPNSIDVMAVGNLPNELPKDASRYFGEQLIKYILRDLIEGNSKIIDRARILDKGKLTGLFAYMEDYALGK
ncbi:MAG: alanine dehydrogenase, partial [Chitinophagaceae bacterium]|nr:alanine dehydrogenase [Chitinophagaceae bacterium]